MLNFSNILNHRFLPVLLLAAVCFTAYSNSLHNDFLVDDHIVLFGETGVQQRPFLALFSGSVIGFYRPVGHIPLKCFHSLFGEKVFLYHLANLFLFFLICLFFFFLTDLLFRSRKLAFWTAALYAAHPVNGMLVNYVTASVISTAVIFMQLTMISFILSFVKERKLYYFFSLVFLVFGILFHEMTAAMPVYLFLYLYFIKRIQSLKKSFLLLTPFLSLLLFYFILKESLAGMRITSYSLFDGIFAAVSEIGIIKCIATITDLIGWYLSKLIMPHGILFLWWGEIANQWIYLKAFMGLFFFLALIYAAVKHWRGEVRGFAAAFFISGFLPILVSSFFYYPFGRPMVEPHWFYFSSFGFFILLADIILRLASKAQKMAWAAPLILIIYIFLALNYNLYWKNQEIFCRYWLSLNMRELTPFHYLGRSLMQKGQYREALNYMWQGMNNNNMGVNRYILDDIGLCYQMLGDDKRADRYFDAAQKMKSTKPIQPIKRADSDP